MQPYTNNEIRIVYETINNDSKITTIKKQFIDNTIHTKKKIAKINLDWKEL